MSCWQTYMVWSAQSIRGAHCLRCRLRVKSRLSRPTAVTSALGGILLQNSLLAVFAMSAYSKSGRFSGFRLTPVRDRCCSVCCFWSFSSFQAGFRIGGDLLAYFASLRRFCAVAVSRISSRAPERPRSLRRSSLKIRFMWAKAISTFLRSSRERLKAGVLAKARTRSRTGSSISRGSRRGGAFGQHCGFKAQASQSGFLAR